MADVMSADKRSALMSRIKGKNTQPELLVRRALWHAGLRYRLHDRRLPGRPDIVLPRWKAVVFVHGCFWHRHAGCPYATLPSNRAEFWAQKLESNRERDLRHRLALLDCGWRVATVWECALRRTADSALPALLDWLRSDTSSLEIGMSPAGISGETLR